MASSRDRKAVLNSLDNLMSEPSDILSSVVARDRAQRGLERITDDTLDKSADLLNGEPEFLQNTRNDGSRVTNDQPIRVLTDSYKAGDLPLSASYKQIEAMPITSEIEARMKKAHELSQGQMVPITLRLPEQLNRWIDEYVHKSWESRLKKQDLIKEALMLLYVHRAKNEDGLLLSELLSISPN